MKSLFVVFVRLTMYIFSDCMYLINKMFVCCFCRTDTAGRYLYQEQALAVSHHLQRPATHSPQMDQVCTNSHRKITLYL